MAENAKNRLDPSHLGMFIVSIIWGASWPIGRIIGRELPPFSAAFLRFAFAFPVLFVVARKMEGRIQLNRRQHLQILGLGSIQVTLYNFLYFLGLRYTSSSDAALIIAINPTLIAIGAAAMYSDEKLSSERIAGLVLAFLGVTLIFWKSPNVGVENRMLGNVIILGAAFAWAAFSVLSRPVYKVVKPITFNAWSSLYGWALLGLLALTEDWQSLSPSLNVWLCLVYLAIFSGAFANSVYSTCIERIGPSRAAIFINLVPVFAILVAIILLGEKFSAWYVVSLLLILFGIRLVNRRPEPFGDLRSTNTERSIK